MKVSVVVCTKNEEQHIGSCLRSLKEQSYFQDRLEIIVVDLNSDDRTREIARDYTEKIYDVSEEVDLTGVKNFRGAQLNFGVSKTSGSVIFYPDADMTFDRDLIKEAVSLLENCDALYVPEVIHGRGFFGKIRNFERSFYNGTCIDAVRFVRKSVFEKVGGFDEKNVMFGPDDWDFTETLKKSGYRLGTITKKLYHHEEGLTLREYIAKKLGYAKTFESYIEKWGMDDLDVKKQLGFGYRFFGVFLEDGKWKGFLARPHLALGVLCLRVFVGASYLLGKALAVLV